MLIGSISQVLITKQLVLVTGYFICRTGSRGGLHASTVNNK